MAASDSLPLPLRNTAYRLYFSMRDSAGALVTAWTSPACEVSLDGGAFSAATNSPVLVGHGTGYLDLEASEMDADAVMVWGECSEGATAEPIVICPKEDGDLSVSMEGFNLDERLGSPSQGSISADIAAASSQEQANATAIYDRIGAPVGATISADVDAVLAKVLNAAGVRAAVGLASANLDTQIAAISSPTITFPEIDGVAFVDYFECAIATLINERVVADNTILVYRRDGETPCVRLTMGTTRGEITGSEILL